MEFNLNKLEIIEVKDFFSYLFTYIYEKYELKRFKYNDKYYSQYPTDHFKKSKKISEKSLDKDINSDSNESTLKFKYITKEEDVKYYFNFLEDRKFNDIFEEEKRSNPLYIIKKIDKLLEDETNFKDIVFKSNFEITIINKSGINEDRRGSDHTEFILPFFSKVIMKKEFSLKELVICAYKLKSHKFDKWYELFCEVSKISIKKEEMSLNLNFDHGS